MRRGLKTALLVIAGLLLVAWILVEEIARRAAEYALEDAWGGTVEIGAVDGLFSKQIVVRRVRVRHPGSVAPLVDIARMRADLEDTILSGDPGDLSALEFEGVRVVVDLGRATSSSSDAGSDGSDAGGEADSGGADAAFELPDPLPDELRILDGRIEVRIPAGEDTVMLPISGVRARVVRRGEGHIELEELAGDLFGGRVTGFGELRSSPERDWNVEANLVDVALLSLTRQVGLEDSVSRGTLAAYVKARRAPEGLDHPAGAGWVTAEQSRVWDLPVFSGVLDALGLAAGHGDYLKEARARFRIDSGRFYFDDLRAVGSPVSLFGHGSMRLDGSELEADFVPRIGRGLAADLPVVGEPTQTLLDVVKGAAIEVQLRGEIAAPEIRTLPLAIVTKPVLEFFDWVAGR